MIRLWWVIFFCFLSQQAFTQSGYEISLSLRPYHTQKVFLAGYMGKSTILIDSVMVDKESKGIFKGDQKLTPGIYFVVSPTKTLLFDFLIGENQQFSIIGDTSSLGSLKFIGSIDNELNQRYSAFMSGKMKERKVLTEKYKTAATKKDSLAVIDQVKVIESEEQSFKENIIATNPGSLIAFLLSAMQRPVVPPIPVVKGKPDSLYPFRYVKDHFWDGVLFNDDRLLHTPFFEPKLDEYFNNYVSIDADSIIKEVNYILLSARTGKEIYPYLLTKFTNKYMTPEYMGQDKVFVYLFEHFFAKGDTSILNESSKKMVTERAYSLMANLIGLPAPPLNLSDTTGKTISLYSINAPYTLIVYWDPNCGHCKEELPKIDSMYRNKWKALGVAVYSICAEGASINDWKKYLSTNKLPTEWKHVYETDKAREANIKAGKPGMRQLYDFYLTPTLYLVDRNKRIIAKKLSLHQFDQIITAKEKNTRH